MRPPRKPILAVTAKQWVPLELMGFQYSDGRKESSCHPHLPYKGWVEEAQKHRELVKGGKGP